MNSKIDALHNKEEKLKTAQSLFMSATPECISDEHKELKENLKHLFEKYNLPKGLVQNWNSNGRGIDLNHNVENNPFITNVIQNKKELRSLN